MASIHPAELPSGTMYSVQHYNAYNDSPNSSLCCVLTKIWFASKYKGIMLHMQWSCLIQSSIGIESFLEEASSSGHTTTISCAQSTHTPEWMAILSNRVGSRTYASTCSTAQIYSISPLPFVIGIDAVTVGNWWTWMQQIP